ncbi:MAG TPA: TolC family protein [Bryobacteraceae bacterium]|nr:TolC family protein [Bryobacteraceae bacterium]
MKCSWLFFTSVLLAAAAEVPGPAEPAVTLAEAVRIAVEKHPDVDKARAGAEILKGKIREVRAQALPDVSINGSAMRMRDPSLLNASGLDQWPAEFRDALVPVGANLFDYRITVKQPLYTAGKVGTALKLAGVEAEGALAEIDRAEQDISLAVVKAFYGLLWAERYERQVAETQEQKKRHAEMAETRYRNGVATEVDVLRSQVQVSNGEPDLVRARAATRQARALLNYYLSRPLDQPTRIAGDFETRPWEDWDLESLSYEAFRRRPELTRLRIAERSAAVQLDLARAENRFRADFQADYGIMSRLTSNLASPKFARWDFTATFTLPVFDGFKRSGLVYQATAAQRQARLERTKTEQQVRLALQQGLDELTAAHQTVEAARANVAQAEKVLTMMQNNYKYGAATTLDIVDAQTALSVARTNLLRGLHDDSVARANLRWMMGEKPWE